jgi:hypothetical protein
MQMALLRVIQAEGASGGGKHALGDSFEVPALESVVIIDAYLGKLRNLVPAEPRDTASLIGVNPDLLRRETGSAGRQKFPDVVASVHARYDTARFLG